MARCVNCNKTISRGEYLCDQCRKNLGIPSARRRKGLIALAAGAILSLPFAARGYEFSHSNEELMGQIRAAERLVEGMSNQQIGGFLLNMPLKQSDPPQWLKLAQFLVDIDQREGPVIRIPKLLLYGPFVAATVLLGVTLVSFVSGMW